MTDVADSCSILNLACFLDLVASWPRWTSLKSRLLWQTFPFKFEAPDIVSSSPVTLSAFVHSRQALTEY